MLENDPKAIKIQVENVCCDAFSGCVWWVHFSHANSWSNVEIFREFVTVTHVVHSFLCTYFWDCSNLADKRFQIHTKLCAHAKSNRFIAKWLPNVKRFPSCNIFQMFSTLAAAKVSITTLKWVDNRQQVVTTTSNDANVYVEYGQIRTVNICSHSTYRIRVLISLICVITNQWMKLFIEIPT